MVWTGHNSVREKLQILGKGFEKRAAHTHKIFLEVTLPPAQRSNPLSTRSECWRYENDRLIWTMVDHFIILMSRVEYIMHVQQWQGGAKIFMSLKDCYCSKRCLWGFKFWGGLQQKCNVGFSLSSPAHQSIGTLLRVMFCALGLTERMDLGQHFGAINS